MVWLELSAHQPLNKIAGFDRIYRRWGQALGDHVGDIKEISPTSLEIPCIAVFIRAGGSSNPHYARLFGVINGSGN